MVAKFALSCERGRLEMGVSLAPRGYAVVKNNVHNVAPEQPAAYSYPTPGPMQMSQIYKTE